MPKHKHEVISNQIFAAFRTNEKKIKEAIEFLEENGYKAEKVSEKTI